MLLAGGGGGGEKDDVALAGIGSGKLDGEGACPG